MVWRAGPICDNHTHSEIWRGMHADMEKVTLTIYVCKKIHTEVSEYVSE